MQLHFAAWQFFCHREVGVYSAITTARHGVFPCYPHQGKRIMIFLGQTTSFFSQLRMDTSRESRESRENIHRYRSYVTVRMANASETMRFRVIREIRVSKK